jgi:serine/threonine protein kinase/Tol biopolymer transport system component
MIGTTISHYKIVEKLGEGGMGVVYKAQDTNLDRFVALKFLPAHASVNAETKARFLQEAKAAAALNHNNICTIYGVDESDGKMFIAMEYIEGGTLREKLPYAKVDDAVTVAIQIGEALQEAHSKGIVHRDIKADNIMLTSKGQAKVMDFGLAKLKGSLKLTKTSSTVGTLGYIAPEQIQGGEVDARSDIFSFGVLLFEMLTGKLPFRGEHEAAIVYSIVNEEPESLTIYRPEVSPEILHILSKALEKDPQDRYQSVNEMVVDLRRSRRDTSRVMKTRRVTENIRGSSSVQAAPAPDVAQQRDISRFFSGRKLWLAVVAVILVLALAGVFLLRKGTLQLDPNMTFRTIQMPFTVFQYPGLSQDASWIVFPAEDANGKWDLYWMHNSGGDARRVTFDSSAAPPNRWLGADISPDGSQIVYSRQLLTGGLPDVCVVSSNGGIGRRVAAGIGPRWRPDGKLIGFVTFVATSRKLAMHSVKPDGTDERTEFVDTLGIIGNNSLAWSPDGQSIAWIRTFPNTTAELIVRNLQSGQEKQLTFDGKNLDDVGWTQQNMIIFSSSKAGNTNLWCVPAGGGEEQQITKGSGPDLGIQVSADGRKLLYYQNQDIGNIWYANGDGTNLRQLTFDEQNITSLCFSPDGGKIVFSMSGEQGFVSFQSHLYIMDRDGSNRRQLTFGDEVAQYPSFSPDGKHLAFRSRRMSEPDDSMKINVIDFPSSSTPKTLRLGRIAWWINEAELTVLYQTASWKVSIQRGTGTRMLEDSTYAFPVESGKFTPFIDLRQGRNGLWVTQDGSKGTRQLTSEATMYIVLPFARFAYSVGSDRTIWKVHLPDGKREKLQGKLPGVALARSMSFSRDGKEIAFINGQSRGKLVMIDNLFK